MESAERLDDRSCRELLRLARSTLEAFLAGRKIPDFEGGSRLLSRVCGAFVSLHRGDLLRGCIGQVLPDRELFRVVQQCAISAASEDTRFQPVRAEELPHIEIEISVLTPPRRADSPEQIEVGRHGIMVTRGYRRGLLLPQVATPCSWDRETFLGQTCRKAGLPESAWKEPGTIIETFEAQVFSEE